MSNEIRYYEDGTQATAANLNKPLQDLNKQGQYMSKAEFESLAEIRRNAYAGSGFIDFGARHESYKNINEGIWLSTSYKNTIIIGDDNNNGVIYDKGDRFPIANINGTLIKIKGTNKYSDRDENFITFPSQTPTSIATITDSTDMPAMKQGDFAILKDLGRELINNGDLSDDNMYSFSGGRADVVIEDNKLKASSQNDAWNWCALYINRYRDKAIKNVKYKLEFDFVQNDGEHISVHYLDSSVTITETGHYVIEGYMKSDYIQIDLHTTNNDDIKDFIFDNFSLKQIEEQPIMAIDSITGGDVYEDNYNLIKARNSISRQDLVFLETWHEKVSEKDIVYPYGNVQYRSGNINGLTGIDKGDFTGKETYSLFGDWQEEGDIIGKGYKWSELSNANKLKFAGDKLNNIYKDGTNIYQVRYRIRVIQGLGNDWKNSLRNNAGTSYEDLRYDNINTDAVRPKTKRITIDELGPYSANGTSALYRRNYGIGTYKLEQDNGLFTAQDSAQNQIDNGFAMMLCLVQRRNDGAFDPVHNPEGCGTFSDDLQWHNTTDSHNNLVDCFTNKGNGNYTSGKSGRPDGLYYDLTNLKDIEDLRMNALKINDKKSYLNEIYIKALKGKIRASEKTKNIYVSKGIGGYPANVGETYLDWSWNSLSTQRYEELNILSIDGQRIRPRDIVGILLSNGKFLKSSGKYHYDGGPGSAGIYLDKPLTEEDAITYNKRDAKVVYLREESNFNNEKRGTCDIIGDPRKLIDRVKFEGGTHNIKIHDYVKKDNTIYSSLINEDDVDLDNETYSDDRWINLGDDSNIGGYINFDKIKFGQANLFDDDLNTVTPYILGTNNNSTGDGSGVAIKLKNRSIQIFKVMVSKKDGTWQPYTYQGGGGDHEQYGYNMSASNHSNKITINTGASYEDMGYASIEEMLHLMTIEIYYDTYANSSVIESSNRIVHAMEDFTCFTNCSNLLPNFTGKVQENLYTDVGENLYNSSLVRKPALGDKLINHSHNNSDIFYSINNEVNNSYTRERPAMKFFPYLTSKYGKANISFVFKEMKWDTTDGWGDDEKFHIDFGMKKRTNDNSVNIISGVKTFYLDRYLED